MFHICLDGTNFAERVVKSQKELIFEHERQERLRSGLKVNDALMKSDPVIKWTPEDIDLLTGMKIKP